MFINPAAYKIQNAAEEIGVRRSGCQRKEAPTRMASDQKVVAAHVSSLEQMLYNACHVLQCALESWKSVSGIIRVLRPIW